LSRHAEACSRQAALEAILIARLAAAPPPPPPPPLVPGPPPKRSRSDASGEGGAGAGAGTGAGAGEGADDDDEAEAGPRDGAEGDAPSYDAGAAAEPAALPAARPRRGIDVDAARELYHHFAGAGRDGGCAADAGGESDDDAGAEADELIVDERGLIQGDGDGAVPAPALSPLPPPLPPPLPDDADAIAAAATSTARCAFAVYYHQLVRKKHRQRYSLHLAALFFALGKLSVQKAQGVLDGLGLLPGVHEAIIKGIVPPSGKLPTAEALLRRLMRWTAIYVSSRCGVTAGVAGLVRSWARTYEDANAVDCLATGEACIAVASAVFLPLDAMLATALANPLIMQSARMQRFQNHVRGPPPPPGLYGDPVFCSLKVHAAAQALLPLFAARALALGAEVLPVPVIICIDGVSPERSQRNSLNTLCVLPLLSDVHDRNVPASVTLVGFCEQVEGLKDSAAGKALGRKIVQDQIGAVLVDQMEALWKRPPVLTNVVGFVGKKKLCVFFAVGITADHLGRLQLANGLQTRCAACPIDPLLFKTFHTLAELPALRNHAECSAVRKLLRENPRLTGSQALKAQITAARESLAVLGLHEEEPALDRLVVLYGPDVLGPSGFHGAHPCAVLHDLYMGPSKYVTEDLPDFITAKAGSAALARHEYRVSCMPRFFDGVVLYQQFQRYSTCGNIPGTWRRDLVRATYLALGDSAGEPDATALRSLRRVCAHETTGPPTPSAGILDLETTRAVLSVMEPLLWLQHYVRLLTYTQADFEAIADYARAFVTNYVSVFGDGGDLKRPKLHKLSELARNIAEWGPPAHFHDGIFELAFKIFMKDEYKRTTHTASAPKELLARHLMYLFCNVELPLLINAGAYNVPGVRRELRRGEEARQVVGSGRSAAESGFDDTTLAQLQRAWKRFRSGSDDSFKASYPSVPVMTFYDTAWIVVADCAMDGAIHARPKRGARRVAGADSLGPGVAVHAGSGVGAVAAGAGAAASSSAARAGDADCAAGAARNANADAIAAALAHKRGGPWFDFVEMAGAPAGAPRTLAQLRSIFTVTSSAGVISPFVSLQYLGAPIAPVAGDGTIALTFAERREFRKAGPGIHQTEVDGLFAVLRSWPVYPRFVGAKDEHRGWFALPVV